MNIVAMTNMLEQYQLECDTANNGEEAVARVRDLFDTQNKTYNLILMDYNMPVCNGI